MKKKLFFFLIFIISFLNLSLNGDIKQVDEINKKSNNEYNKNNFEESIKVSKKALHLARKINYSKGELKALIDIADNYFQLNKFEKATNTYRIASKLADSINNIDKLIYCYKKEGICLKIVADYNNSIAIFKKVQKLLKNKVDIIKIEYEIGEIYREKGQVEKALEIFHKSLTVFESFPEEKKYHIRTLHLIGEIFHNEKQYSKAIEYFKKAEIIALGEKFNELQADSLAYLGGTYEEKKDFKKAERSYKKAIIILNRINDEYRLATVYNNLGEVYRKINRFELAKTYYLKALKKYRGFEYQWGVSAALANLGAVSVKSLDIKNALVYLKEAKEIAEKKNIPALKEFIYNTISEVYEKNGETKKSLLYFKKYIKINNEILNKERITKFAEMQTKYETARKDKEIEKSKSNLDRQNLISKVILGGLIIVILLIFLIYSRYRLKKRANAELSIINTDLNVAKQQIEKKNQHITDSIIYAKKIQNAILPTKKELQQSLKAYFIIYRPKDIVSGDFFWLYEDDTKLIISVIDCTGHGVPGALMSVMGNSLLNEIVSKNNIKPEQILTELNNGILKSLKKTDGKSRINDGMDVCLFFIDKNNSKTFYSGARRPLFVIKKNSAILTEYKGIRLSIGESTKKRNKNFISDEIFLESGDMIYLTSDGYADQSNTEEKKIGSKKLRDILSMIAFEPLNKQQLILETELDLHQGKEEQRDDITILGFRI